MKTTFKPILFSTEMVQAILEGRKTLTRRTLKNIPRISSNINSTVFYLIADSTLRDIYCPFGKPGDILWVREKFRVEESFEFDGEYFPESVWYYATTAKKIKCVDGDTEDKDDYKWKPGIHMPKEACRLFLKVTNVRVERLHDITEEDAKAEGVLPVNVNDNTVFLGYKNYKADPKYKFLTCKTAAYSFESLWKSINGKNSWKDNPWVWVIEFERIEKPENFLNN